MSLAPRNRRVIHQVRGTVRQVDPVSREVRLLVAGELLDFVVPPDCVIVVNDERVKLRLLQPGDEGELSYSWLGPVAFAHSIHAGGSPAAARRPHPTRETAR